MKASIIENQVGADIDGFSEIFGRPTVEAVALVAESLGRYVNVRERWRGGEDGGYIEVIWDRAMFIEDQCAMERGEDLQRLSYYDGLEWWME